jgi:type I restriction enzyme, S subunit
MSKQWQLLELEKVSRVVDSLHKTPEFTDSGYPMVRAADVKGGFLDLVETKLVSQEDFLDFTRNHKPQQGDIVLSRVGSYFNFSYNKSGKEFCIGQNTSIIVPEIESRFLYYSLISPFVQDQVERSLVGTSQRTLSLKYIRELKIPVPSISEQRAIAGILGSVDDKIELNRRMNATLESMARAVFREVIKNGKGEERTIGDVVTIVGGSTPSTTNPVLWDDGDIHWATPKDLAPLQSPFLLETNSWITELGLKEISSGLLPVGTVLLSSRAPIGYLAITQIPVAINQGFIAIKCTKEVPNYFVLNWLKENMEEIIGRANGTTFLEISKSNFRPMKIVVPPHPKIKTFVEVVEPLYQKIVANLKESHTLASLRDTLLPKLMRGAVRVKGLHYD